MSWQDDTAPPVGTVTVLPVHGVPEIRGEDDLARHLATALEGLGGLTDGDILVVSSKVVSKALGLRVPGTADRDALVLEHARRVVAERVVGDRVTRIVEAVAGPVMAGAGLDASNTGPDGGVLVLPPDPDAAARTLHTGLKRAGAGRRFAVVLSDTAGRPWRSGQTDFALGSHGLRVLDDLRGATDADGRGLAVTARAVADEIAAAADLVKGKTGSIAAAVVRGLDHLVDDGGAGAEPHRGAQSLVRTGPGDWFALGHREAVRTSLGAPPASPAAAAVGIASVAPEDPVTRGDRAVRLALLGQSSASVPGSASVSVSGDPSRGYAVSSPDPVTAGRVAARLEVALHGEDLGEVPVRVDLGRVARGG
ncbi:coenzyme F420-0:L-glutamate ligase [Ornithinimicrobium panacihumi]|uniref:coenzyme F420-0:L-glutamate ligase n=1 Tax=Ornithinimicrobium panacihumi TaxID=2008449 RepID=UPI003F8A42C1